MAHTDQGRDELGRFTTYLKQKGSEALDKIKTGVGDAARSLSVGADEVADKLGAAPRARPGMETDDELEQADARIAKGVANATLEHVGAGRMEARRVDRNTKTGKEYTHPTGTTDEMAKSHYDDGSSFPPKGPAKKPAYKPWGMEKKKGW